MLDYNDLQEKLKKSISIANLHLQRMNSSFHFIHSVLPVTDSNYTNLNDEQIAYIDQYIFRFAKLQDIIGKKIFKTILQFEYEDTDDYSFRDVLNGLEKLKIINSVSEWLELREIRNEVSHEYPITDEDSIKSLNKLFEKRCSLENIFQSCLTHIESKNYLKS